MLHYLFTKGANFVICARLRFVIGSRVGGYLFGHFAAFICPFFAAAVHDAHMLVAVKPKHPKRVAGPPVAFVAVEDNRGVVANSVAAAECFEAFAIQIVTPDAVIEIIHPVDHD